MGDVLEGPRSWFENHERKVYDACVNMIRTLIEEGRKNPDSYNPNEIKHLSGLDEKNPVSNFLKMVARSDPHDWQRRPHFYHAVAQILGKKFSKPFEGDQAVPPELLSALTEYEAVFQPRREAV